ncbi:MAG: hypothetical protein ACLU45_01665 [Dialister invisus]|uniref:DUF7338 family protein n=1 Tax=Dialister invisus TaxID=218538 RepID=UPI00399B2327
MFWLSRNCAYGFALTLFGATINPDDIVVIDDYKAGEFERNILVTRDLKHWKVYNSMRILNTNYRWRIYLGWKIHDVKTFIMRCWHSGYGSVKQIKTGRETALFLLHGIKDNL